MQVKAENGADRGDDDEWGDLITAPNRLIYDQFCVFKAEKLDDRVEGDEGKGREQEQEGSVCSEGRGNGGDSLEGKVRSRRVGIAERRAAKFGSDGDASRIRVSVSSSPATACSQFFTVPSGISPTSCFDPPMLLPNSQDSPTTGTLSFPPLKREILGMNPAVEDMSSDTGFSTYQAHGGSLLWPYMSDLQNQFQPPVLSEFPDSLLNEPVTKGCATDTHSSEDSKILKNTIQSPNGAAVQLSHTDNQTSHPIQPTEGDGYQKETCLPNMRNSEDGYNWRKYGQKQVKGSEYPRSYYKCTHPNCQVKKKVERSHDGHITEIIYKGNHNHQRQHNMIGSPASIGGNGSYIKIEEGEAWGNIHQGGTNNIAAHRDWTPDGMELSSSTSVVTDNSDLISVTQGKSMGIFEPAGNPERSSSNTNYDVNEEDGTNIGTLSPGGDEADEDKSELKRRKKGNFMMDTSLVTRAMREPRVVVQIESDVDILDDGYRWRKYGQKVVKGNPNPRSYYKCTSTGCPVRKHVERASDDLKSVLTTYEGKHNHEVPAARNSSHANTDIGSAPNPSLSRITNIPKSKPDLSLHFDRKLGNEYMPSSFIGNLDTDHTQSSIYQTKFVPFPSPMPFGPDFSMPLPMTTPNMAHAGFGYGKRGSFIGGQGQQNSGRFVRPRLEQDDGFYDTYLRAPDDSSSRYIRVIPNFRS